jgi:aldose sugar dehydrogenase
VPKHLFWIVLCGGFFVACNPGSEGHGPASDLPDPDQGQRRNTNIQRLYEESCGKCHGMRGEGGGAGTKTLLTREKFDQKHDRPYFDAIKKGVPDMGMEPFGEALTDEEIWGLVVYIRELQAQALRREFGSPRPSDGVYSSQHHKFRLETAVDTDQGLATPWSIDWLPDGRMLITNRPGKLVLAKDGKVQSEVAGIPESVEIGQGGLMEVAVHPNYAQNGWIYLTYCDPAKNGNGGMTKVVRGKLDGTRWTSQQTIYEAEQEFYSRAGVHFGSKIAFDGKGKLYFSVGERGTNMRAQDPATPFGKVMRVNEDGSIPADNPFPNSPVWSYGHRNQQGLAFDANGNLWDTEHGPRGGDEVNLIQKGANYGWPVVAFSINYQGTPFRTPWPKDDLKITQPIFRWLPSIGASGLDLVEGAAFPKWSGDLLAGGLSGANVDRFRIVDGKLVEREELLHGLGRVRDIKVAKDGTIYVALNGPDKIIRLVPAP